MGPPGGVRASRSWYPGDRYHFRIRLSTQAGSGVQVQMALVQDLHFDASTAFASLQ